MRKFLLSLLTLTAIVGCQETYEADYILAEERLKDLEKTEAELILAAQQDAILLEKLQKELLRAQDLLAEDLLIIEDLGTQYGDITTEIIRLTELLESRNDDLMALEIELERLRTLYENEKLESTEYVERIKTLESEIVIARENIVTVVRDVQIQIITVVDRITTEIIYNDVVETIVVNDTVDVYESEVIDVYVDEIRDVFVDEIVDVTVDVYNDIIVTDTVVVVQDIVRDVVVQDFVDVVVTEDVVITVLDTLDVYVNNIITEVVTIVVNEYVDNTITVTETVYNDITQVNTVVIYQDIIEIIDNPITVTVTETEDVEEYVYNDLSDQIKELKDKVLELEEIIDNFDPNHEDFLIDAIENEIAGNDYLVLSRTRSAIWGSGDNQQHAFVALMDLVDGNGVLHEEVFKASIGNWNTNSTFKNKGSYSKLGLAADSWNDVKAIYGTNPITNDFNELWYDWRNGYNFGSGVEGWQTVGSKSNGWNKSPFNAIRNPGDIGGTTPTGWGYTYDAETKILKVGVGFIDTFKVQINGITHRIETNKSQTSMVIDTDKFPQFFITVSAEDYVGQVYVDASVSGEGKTTLDYQN